MVPAAVLSVIVKAQGVRQANARLAALNTTGMKAARGVGGAAAATTAAGAAAGKAGGKFSGAGKQIGAAGTSSRKAAAAAGGLGGKLKGLGPMAALAGAAAAGLGTQFEDSMSRIEGLVGASSKQVDDWSSQLLKLGPQIGKSPRELADALFFVTSAGIKGTKAIDALTFSAKASAAGLGETEVVADAITSAMNAYGPKTMSAAKATDTLTSVVREGKLEASALSGAIGRVLPIAAEMGVKFEDVGGAVAHLSRSGASASEAITGVRGIMSKILKPTEAGKEALAGVGMSFDEVRKSLKQRGLLATLTTLRGKFGDNTEALGKVFEDVEALNAVLSLTNKGGKEAAKVFDGVADSAGATEKAFEASKTTGFRFRQALAFMEAQGAKLAKVLGNLIGFFAENKDAMTALLVVVGMLTTGFVAYKVATIAAAVSTGGLTTAMVALAVATRAHPLVALITVLAAVAAGLVILYKRSEAVRNIIDAVGGAFKAAGKWIVGAAEWIGDAAPKAFAAVKTAIDHGLLGPIPVIIKHWGAIKKFLGDAWSWLKKSATDAFNAVLGVITGAWGAVRSVTGSVLSRVLAIITGAWSAVRTATRAAWDAIKTAVLTPIRAARDILVTVVSGITSRLAAGWSTIKSAAATAWDAIRTAVLTPIRNARDTLVTVVTGITSRLGNGWSTIKAAASTAWDAIRGAILTPLRAARDAVSGIIDGAKNRLETGFGRIKTAVGTFGTSIKTTLSNAFKGAANGVIGFLNKIISAVNSIPGVPDVGKIPKLAQGGTVSRAGVQQGPQMLARGGVVRRPTAIVGEEGPAHPEYVIPTNPSYRPRALKLMAGLSQKLGVPMDHVAHYARGGIMGRRKAHRPGSGGPLDVVKDVVTAPIDLPLKAFEQGAKFFLDKLPGVGSLPGWLKGTGKHVLKHVGKYIKDKAGNILGDGDSGGLGMFAGNLGAIAKLSIAKFGLSGGRGPGQAFRPGDPGWHGKNRARDISGPPDRMMAFARFVAGAFGKNLLELIYTPMGFSIKNGRRTAPYAQADHYDHVHVAMKLGGMLSRMGFTGGSAPFGGSFGGGGVVPGPTGVPRRIVAHGGEVITPAAGGGTPSFGPVVLMIGGQVIDERIDVKFGDEARALLGTYQAGVIA